MTGDILTTSIHAQDAGSRPPSGLRATTIQTTTRGAITEPQNSPNIVLLIRCVRNTRNPQMLGQNCE